MNFYLTVDANNSVNSRISTVIIKQDESDNTIYLKVTQQANPIYKFKGLVMISGLNASFSDPDTYMEFDINTRYFDYPGNGNELIIAERG